MSSTLTSRRLPVVYLLGACALLVILWLPGVHYPIVSDTAIYALLGESFWEQGRFTLLGESYAKHLPLHAVLSYPLTQLLGYHLGMKVSTLLAGMSVLVISFLLLRRTFSLSVAMVSVGIVLTNHAFVLMTMLGSADLLFTALFLLSLYSLVRASENIRWYVPTFVILALACLTRYNGAPLFIAYPLFVFWRRREDMRSWIFWIALCAGCSIFGLWFLRNFIVFGDPLYTEYTGELIAESPHILRQFASNMFYYLNPTHNILPLLFFCGLYGLWKRFRENDLLVITMCAVWILTAFWWVQAMRFAFPGYVILIGFASWGILDLLKRFPLTVTFVTVLLLITTHGGALCLYSYGACNSWIDRQLSGIPKHLGISSEGFYTWDQARKFLNATAELNATVYVYDPLLPPVWSKGVFRDDLLVSAKRIGCPLYRIIQNPTEGEVLYTTEDEPKTSVTKLPCR